MATTSPGAAMKLGRVFSEWLDIWSGSSESTLIERRLTCWRSMRKREVRIAVRLREEDGGCGYSKCY